MTYFSFCCLSLFIPSCSTDACRRVRMEVAQRMKEVKLMTQPGVGLLPPADSLSGTSVLAAPKLDGDAAALEGQIALLTKRIESIANHLQVPFLIIFLPDVQDLLQFGVWIVLVYFFLGLPEVPFLHYRITGACLVTLG